MGRKVSVEVSGCGTIVNYPLSFEGSEVQNLVINEVTAGNRWDVDIIEGSREYTARYEAELVSGLPFYAALGSMTPSCTCDPFTVNPRTIKPYATLPDCTITAHSEADSMRVKNAKCDRLRLNWGGGEFITYESEWIGTIGASTYAVSGTTTWNINGITCASLRVMIDSDTLTEVQSGWLEINNNLEARYACGKGKKPRKIREQRLEVTGAITVGQDDISYFTTGGHSFELMVRGLGGGSLEIRVGSIWFDELPDEFTGHDVYEIEFTWTAQPYIGGNIIEVVDTSTVVQW